MALILTLVTFQLDPEVSRAMTRAIAGLNSFRVHFHQLTYSDFFDETEAEGTFSVDRPGRMRMAYTKGEEILRIWDGETAFERDLAAETENRADQSELVDEPIVQLLLYGSELTRTFLVDRVERDGVDIFRFRPRDEDDAYYLEVRFDDAWLPRVIEVIGEDGEGTRFTFTDYELDPQFSADTFTIPPER